MRLYQLIPALQRLAALHGDTIETNIDSLVSGVTPNGPRSIICQGTLSTALEEQLREEIEDLEDEVRTLSRQVERLEDELSDLR